MRRVALLAAILVLTLAAAPPTELHFAISGDPKTFDPLQVSESNAEMVRYLTAGVLIRVNRNTGQLEPELAESWTLPPDGKSISLHLRAALKFSDGAAAYVSGCGADPQPSARSERSLCRG